MAPSAQGPSPDGCPAPARDLGAAAIFSRRELIRAGAFGSLALLGAGAVASWARIGFSQGGAALAFFKPDQRALAQAVIEWFAGQAMPAESAAHRDAVEQSVLTVDRYLSALSPVVQAEARQALDLLQLAPARWLTGGMWGRWESAAPEDVSRFLERYRTSRSTTLRQIYLLLEGLAAVGWYGQPAAWAALGYPGPPNVARPRGEKPL
jgi:hypothetical protein